MVLYRVYCLDGVNRFTRTESFEAPDDEAAARRTRELMADCVKAEVWDRDRLVARLNGHE